jgi:GTP-binding protein
VTRDRRYADGNIGDMDLTLIDTAGYEDVTDDSLEARMREQTELALEDGRRHPVHDGRPRGRDAVGRDLRRASAQAAQAGHPARPTSPKAARAGGGVGEAYSLGFGEPVAISAEHGEGMADLYAALVASADIFIEEIEEPDKPIRIAIIGRPNAGKSTLINRLIGEDRLLTGPEAGITRDSISVDWEYEGRTSGWSTPPACAARPGAGEAGEAVGRRHHPRHHLRRGGGPGDGQGQRLRRAGPAAGRPGRARGRALVYVAAKWDLEDQSPRPGWPS